MSLKLSDRLDIYVSEWLEEHLKEATNGNTESMIICSKLLIRGSKSLKPDPEQGIYWLKKAANISSEAAFRLGKIYKKGIYTNSDIQKAFFYFRLASFFPCRCGALKEKYHSNQITNTMSCYPDEAGKILLSLNLPECTKQRFEEEFLLWQNSLNS